MLTCVFHPVNGMQVVEEDKAETLIQTGFWFNHPNEAQEYRSMVEEEIKQSDAKKARKNKEQSK